mgnify:FL=1
MKKTKIYNYIIIGLILVFLLFTAKIVISDQTKTETQKAHEKAVNICQQFFDNEITAAEARERLDGMYFPDTVDGNLIETYVGMISYDLLCYDTQGFDRYLRSLRIVLKS